MTLLFMLRIIGLQKRNFDIRIAHVPSIDIHRPPRINTACLFLLQARKATGVFVLLEVLVGALNRGSSITRLAAASFEAGNDYLRHGPGVAP